MLQDLQISRFLRARGPPQLHPPFPTLGIWRKISIFPPLEHADMGANSSERPAHRQISKIHISEVGANSSERPLEHADMGAN